MACLTHVHLCRIAFSGTFLDSVLDGVYGVYGDYGDYGQKRYLQGLAELFRRNLSPIRNVLFMSPRGCFPDGPNLSPGEVVNLMTCDMDIRSHGRLVWSWSKVRRRLDQLSSRRH